MPPLLQSSTLLLRLLLLLLTVPKCRQVIAPTESWR
jgi:hypothetical protein